MDNWKVNQIKMIVFDVDGTLYDQSALRPRMMLNLLMYYSIRPFRLKELLVLYHFRKEREKNALLGVGNISENQFKWCQQKVNYPIHKIKDIVQKWMFKKPLKYLQPSVYKEVIPFINTLKKKGITIAVYSDYNSEQKLSAMNIEVDYIFSSEQVEINELKPSPKGLNFIAEHLNIDKKNILYIGDRQKIDGASANSAGIEYLILDPKTANYFYKTLKQKFDLGE